MKDTETETSHGRMDNEWKKTKKKKKKLQSECLSLIVIRKKKKSLGSFVSCLIL